MLNVHNTLDAALTSHSASCSLSALIEPPLHLMACLILIETELALEVKYVFIHGDNPPFLNESIKAFKSCKIASIN